MAETERSLPVIWHEAYEADIGAHVFPTNKYRAIRARLIEEGTISEADIVRLEPATDEDVALVHTPEYLQKIKTGSFTPQEIMILESLET